MLKKLIFYIITCSFTFLGAPEIQAQTNTFPSSGNVGIGTTSPNSLLTLQGTLNLNVRANYGGDFPTDNDNYQNVLAIGGIGAESGLKIYKQAPGDSPSFLGPSNWNDSYIFEMTDTNSNTPDGGILFAATGKDDLFEGIFYIRGNGRVGVGVNNPSAKFEVDGLVRAEEIIVEENIGADFVFDHEYTLPVLSEVESFIKEHGHLSGIPSAEEMKQEGIKVGELQVKLLQKIEELTLYLIEQQKRIDYLERINKKESSHE